MRTVWLLFWIASLSSCIELSLPYSGPSGVFDIVEFTGVSVNGSRDKAYTQMNSITSYDSRSEEVITKVVFMGVEIFNKEEPPHPDQRRLVHYVIEGEREFVVIELASQTFETELAIYKDFDTLYNLTEVENAIRDKLYGCNSKLYNCVTTTLYSRLPVLFIPNYYGQNIQRVDQSSELEEVKPVDDEVEELVGRLMVAIEFAKVDLYDESKNEGDSGAAEDPGAKSNEENDSG